MNDRNADTRNVPVRKRFLNEVVEAIEFIEHSQDV
jgi:hypothetical protein